MALKGVRRASVFLGLGVNAAIDSRFTSFQLTKITQIQLLPDDISPETLKHFKDEFRSWIEAAALRELSETFAVYLDKLYEACLIIRTVGKREPFDCIEMKQLKFARMGLPGKLKALEQEYSVESKRQDSLLSIGKARNCLAHRRGLVGPEDLDTKGKLCVTWSSLDIFIETPSGKIHHLNEISEEGLPLPEGGTVKAQNTIRTRSFGRGESILFSTRDLAEICWFYEQEARLIHKSAFAFAINSGAVFDQSEVEEK